MSMAETVEQPSSTTPRSPKVTLTSWAVAPDTGLAQSTRPVMGAPAAIGGTKVVAPLMSAAAVGQAGGSGAASARPARRGGRHQRRHHLRAAVVTAGAHRRRPGRLLRSPSGGTARRRQATFGDPGVVDAAARGLRLDMTFTGARDGGGYDFTTVCPDPQLGRRPRQWLHWLLPPVRCRRRHRPGPGGRGVRPPTGERRPWRIAGSAG